MKEKLFNDKLEEMVKFNIRLIENGQRRDTPLKNRVFFQEIAYKNLMEFLYIKYRKANKYNIVDINKALRIAFKYLSKAVIKLDSIFEFLYRGDLKETYSDINDLVKVEIKKDPVPIVRSELYYFVFVHNGELHYIEGTTENNFLYNGKGVYISSILEQYLYEIYGHIIRVYTFKIIRKPVEGIDFESKREIMGNHIEDTEEEKRKKYLKSFLAMISDCRSKDINEAVKNLFSANAVKIELYLDRVSIGMDKTISTVNDYHVLPSYPKVNAEYEKINYLDRLKTDEVVVYTPFQSYQMVLDFIDEMCTSPEIKIICISLYRVNADVSTIVASLMKGARSGKEVYVNIETLARGDEENNQVIADELVNSGCIVTSNWLGYKVHCKAFCAVSETGEIYSHLATGNYNESTAKMYTDISLITGNKVQGFGILELFKNIFYRENFIVNAPTNRLLTQSPFTSRERLIKLINAEIRKGSFGRVYIKCNNLHDNRIMYKLYKAAIAGCDVKVIARTICGLKSYNENTRVRSKVGQFLEHERIYIIGDSVHISSADLLRRNLDRRIELLVGITNPKTKNKILNIFMHNWHDYKNLWYLDYNDEWLSYDFISEERESRYH